MQLRYIGPVFDGVGALPLEEGWPAADHVDANEATAKRKLASGMYERVVPATTGRGKAPAPNGEE